MNSGSVGVRAELAAEPQSVRAARRLVRTALQEARLDHLEGSALLLVSELATNAVLHARSGFVVEVTERDGHVRVGVTDASPQGPARRSHGVSAGTGRGLGLVAALSTGWGTEDADEPWRKTVWFELPVDPDALPEPDEGALLLPR